VFVFSYYFLMTYGYSDQNVSTLILMQLRFPREFIEQSNYSRIFSATANALCTIFFVSMEKFPND